MASGKLSSIITTLFAPIVTAFKNKMRELETNYKTKKITFSKDLTGEATIQDTDTEKTITVTVNDDSHNHANSEIPASVPALPNTIALRDANGNLFSSDSTSTNTGYKLADNADITTIFAAKADPNVVLSTPGGNGGSMNMLSDVTLSKDGNKIKCNTSWYSNCTFVQSYQCQCCD